MLNAETAGRCLAGGDWLLELDIIFLSVAGNMVAARGIRREDSCGGRLGGVCPCCFMAGGQDWWGGGWSSRVSWSVVLPVSDMLL